MRRWFFALVFLLWVTPVIAQTLEDCPAFVEEGVSSIDNVYDCRAQRSLLRQHID